MIVTQSANVIQSSFADLWFTVVQYLPAILASIIVFVIGWIVGTILYRVVVEIVKVLRIDEVMKAAGLDDAARTAGFKLDVGAFLGTLVMWFVVIVFLVASLDILGLNRVTIFLQQVVLLYLPQVIVAVLILILAAVVAEVVRNLVSGSARAVGAHGANLAGSVAKWAIWTFAVLAVLNQLGVATEFVQTLFTGLVVALALAFGLAFGLGGKEAAARTIEKVRSEIAHHHD
ncbi:MAG: Small-conductance mechanosensitive ion channel-like protein [Candidatus Kaiserbacteria bacterium GW2011_GWC2_52_8b]|uniref:Small-conductance mechanosensitive ion channel-like protein n=2 Tax=Candidatus Kaiseribacteriota TaxID=1752734 RepID=A0A0G2AFF9_9BACT|nr:MAG: Small-conductance mechanosensitive ion channel-like protein [Candidatus Kaiserbacteria bacterium GW2011_GWA2_52_12]KKW31229.1 MAG: Small-conductance mechanosensitive ion channel-like protein [Candidatus Kaiserbacteria bacterium GW2011_GWC2_52_8b]